MKKDHSFLILFIFVVSILLIVIGADRFRKRQMITKFETEWAAFGTYVENELPGKLMAEYPEISRTDAHVTHEAVKRYYGKDTKQSYYQFCNQFRIEMEMSEAFSQESRREQLARIEEIVRRMHEIVLEIRKSETPFYDEECNKSEIDLSREYSGFDHAEGLLRVMTLNEYYDVDFKDRWLNYTVRDSRGSSYYKEYDYDTGLYAWMTPEEHLQKEQQRKKVLLNQSIAANSTGSSVKPTYGADSAATAKPSNGTGSAAKKKSSKKKTTTYDVDPYDAGYEDVYLDYDYDEDRYRWDDDYMRGVDDAMDDLDEDW